MRVKNLTPFVFGYKEGARRPPQSEMTCVVRARFTLKPGVAPSPLPSPRDIPDFAKDADLEELARLAQGTLSSDTFGADDEERKGAVVHPSDFADFKRNTDVMLRGSFHARKARPVREGTVRFAVGGWSKELRVVGPRVWVDRILGGRSTEPLPFTTVPIDWAHAFGGPELAVNPVGTGHSAAALPNVEPTTGPKNAPASFAPINPAWPQRAGLVGTNYGEAYQRERAPYFADDFDYSHFQAAPPDQQLTGYLKGDEELRFDNLHPDSAVIETRLPAIRIRVFLRNAEGAFIVAKMRLDTLLADLENEVLELTWRGLIEVRENDLSDVEFALVVSEELATEPKPESHYRDLLEAHAKDPIGLQALTPEGFGEAEAAFLAREGGDAPKVDPDDDNPLTGALGGAAGKLLGPALTILRQAFADAGPSMGTPDVKTAMQQSLSKPAPGGTAASGLRLLVEGLAPVRAQAIQSGADPKIFAKLDAKLADPRLAAVVPGLPPGGVSSGPEEEPGPGKNLSGRDLTDRDLHGIDLSACMLEGANLSGANLTGANLTGCNLRNALFVDTNLTGATLARADLSSADFSRARALGANLEGATLDRALFYKTNLDGADLRGAKGEMTSFVEACLSGIRGTGLSLTKSSFEECFMEDADLSGASLLDCLCRKARAARMILRGSKLGATSFMQSSLQSADLRRVSGSGTVWMGATLDDADFSEADLPESYFLRVSASATRFVAADLREARFDRANLKRAVFTTANLLRADFRKAVLSTTVFTGANLYDAKFVESAGTSVDFRGSNLLRASFSRSTLERR